MLVIRSQQLDALSRNAAEAFQIKLARHLEAFLPTRGVLLPAEEIRKQIERGMGQCEDFGMELQSDVARLFEIVCGSMGGFTGAPLPVDALRILYAYKMDPELKLQRLQAWAEAQGK